MKIFLTVMLVVSVILNLLLAGCCIISDQAAVSNEIKVIAGKCNISTSGKSSMDLLKEIREYKASPEKEKAAPTGELTKYYGGKLTEEDWEHIRFSLKSRPGTIETLEKYDKFIKEIKGKDIRVYPPEN